MSLSRLAESPQPIFEEWGRVMVTSVGQNFKSGGRPERWKPLKKASAIAHLGKRDRKSLGSKRKRTQDKALKKLRSEKVLIKTSRLARSIRSWAERDGVLIGTNVKYAPYHQQNNPAFAKKSNLPARPFLVVQKSDEKNMVRVLFDKLFQEWKG